MPGTGGRTSVGNSSDTSAVPLASVAPGQAMLDSAYPVEGLVSATVAYGTRAAPSGCALADGWSSLTSTPGAVADSV